MNVCAFLIITLQGQFIIVTAHSVQLFFIPCNYPILFAYWILSYAVIFLAMFLNFYIQSYRRSKVNKSTAAAEKGSKASTAAAVTNGHHKTS